MLVSIIIPTFNRLGKIQRALDSVLRQSFHDFEVIVVDDGSTDSTLKWLQRCEDVRLKIVSITHQGVAAARNAGVKQASGEWLCFLDSDDVWHRHKLSEQIHYHAAHREILFSQTDDVWIRNSVRVNKMKKHSVREGDIFRDSLKLCLVCCSSVMIHKELFQEVGGFDETLPTCEDYDLWIRLLAQRPIGFVNKKLVTKFGGHEDQLSKKFEMMDKYRLQSLQKILATCALSTEQRQAVQEEIAIKTDIINKGIIKRNRRAP